MSSRDVVLDRIRRALTPFDRAAAEQTQHTEHSSDSPVVRDYLRAHAERTPQQRTDLLAEHLADYRAIVHRTGPDGIRALVAELLGARRARTVAIPAGLPGGWVPEGVEPVPDTTSLTPRRLDAVDSVLTGCTVAVAETGTIVLDGGEGQGRRRITLVPDHHICVVRVPGQVVDSVPEALERLDPARPLTWISGPSATSDIELDRVEGVHGPRTLDVILLDG